ncbi:unnamed protein product [Periconia digitata]|uniref:Uncharacterized protein n=1 Tax=Periconia digitata TaxID=1303443 RepID=A0A9W4XTW1_9PLEO|nr:unnamed protein product [Periconia digitata]
MAIHGFNVDNRALRLGPMMTVSILVARWQAFSIPHLIHDPPHLLSSFRPCFSVLRQRDPPHARIEQSSPIDRNPARPLSCALGQEQTSKPTNRTIVPVGPCVCLPVCQSAS